MYLFFAQSFHLLVFTPFPWYFSFALTALDVVLGYVLCLVSPSSASSVWFLCLIPLLASSIFVWYHQHLILCINFAFFHSFSIPYTQSEVVSHLSFFGWVIFKPFKLVAAFVLLLKKQTHAWVHLEGWQHQIWISNGIICTLSTWNTDFMSTRRARQRQHTIYCKNKGW